MLAALALLLSQDQSQVTQAFESPGFRFSMPPAADILTQSGNGQVYFIELRKSGQESSPPYLKLFSLPNPEGAVDAATLFSLSAQEFASLAAAASLTPGAVTEEVLPLRLGEAASQSQVFTDAGGAAVARARTVILQTSPMAAGAMIWQAPGQPASLMAAAETLLAGLQVLPFAADALEELERYGARFAVPLLWTRQEKEANGTLGVNCQGPIGTVFVSTGASGIFGGELGEGFVLDGQRGEANAVAANYGGTVMRQNALMRLVDEQLQVGQRFLLALPGGGQAEIRNAIFSDRGQNLCLIGALYAWDNRPAMVALLDRMLAAVSLPLPAQQQVETRSWSGMTVRFPARLELEEREPAAFLPGGWTFTIPHDKNPADRSFELRIWREDSPAVSAEPQLELQRSLEDLTKLWPGATIENLLTEDAEAFGQPAAALRATLRVDGVDHTVDARRVVAAHGIFRSLAYFPADLISDHEPVLDFILERSNLWEGDQPPLTTSGAAIRLPGPGWWLRDFQLDGRRAFALSNGKDLIIRCVPDPEMTPEHDLAAALAVDYFEGDAVDERLELQLAGSTIPGLTTRSTFTEEEREVEYIEFHALFAADGAVWHLSAGGPAEGRPQLLAALAGIALPGR